MIAWMLRAAWVVMIVAAAGAAWLSIRWFGPAIGPWAAGLAGATLVFASHPLLIAFNFLVSRVTGDPVPPALRLSPWAAIRTYDAEVDASVRGFWFATPFRPLRPAARPAAGIARKPIPILFVHGYLCNRAVWLSFMQDAARRGYWCHAPTLDDPFDDIDGNTDAIDRAIDALLADAAQNGIAADRVAVVAHSMGGLVVRAALQRIDRSRVARVITLGTPHRGTVLARFGIAASVVQMRRGSPWLRRLDEAERAGCGLMRSACTTIYTVHDDIVYPQTTGGLDGTEQIPIGGVGHVALLYDRQVRTLVFERLDQLAAAS